MAPGRPAQIVGGPQPVAPARQETDWGGLVFFLLIVLGALAYFHWQMRRQRDWIDARMDVQIQAFKNDLPPILLVGEAFSKEEAAEHRHRLEQLEARTRNLEKRLEGLSVKKPA